MKEYKFIQTRIELVEKTMNDMAKEGYEVVSVLQHHYYLKKLMITFAKNI